VLTHMASAHDSFFIACAASFSIRNITHLYGTPYQNQQGQGERGDGKFDDVVHYHHHGGGSCKIRLSLIHKEDFVQTPSSSSSLSSYSLYLLIITFRLRL